MVTKYCIVGQPSNVQGGCARYWMFGIFNLLKCSDKAGGTAVRQLPPLNWRVSDAVVGAYRNTGTAVAARPSRTEQISPPQLATSFINICGRPHNKRLVCKFSPSHYRSVWICNVGVSLFKPPLADSIIWIDFRIIWILSGGFIKNTNPCWNLTLANFQKTKYKNCAGEVRYNS